MFRTEIGVTRPVSRWSLFAVPDFRRLWIVGLVLFVVRWLEIISVGVFTYEATNSAFIVAMMTMLRLLPMGLFGAFIGAAAERIERRTALLVIIASLAVGSATVAVLAHSGHLAVWQLAVASFVNGIGWATDNPVRRVMIGEAAGAERMSLAMSIDVGANTASRMLGPSLGGAMLATIGIDGTFMIGAVLYGVALVCALSIGMRNTSATAGGGSVLARIAEGMRFARQDARLHGTLVVTLLFNLFGWPTTSMIPVIGRDIFALGPEGVGLLASIDGVGAFAGAFVMARFSQPGSFRNAYVGGTFLYFAAVTLFALAPWVPIAAVALLLTGVGGAAFSIMQATLIYLSAPVDMRSRMLGVLSVCIGLGPIGFVMLGGLAELIGAQYATAASGIAGVICLLLTRRVWRMI